MPKFVRIHPQLKHIKKQVKLLLSTRSIYFFSENIPYSTSNSSTFFSRFQTAGPICSVNWQLLKLVKTAHFGERVIIIKPRKY